MSDVLAQVVADVLDAIDPRLTEAQRHDAARRAVRRDPLFALVCVCGFAQGVISRAAEVTGDIDGLMQGVTAQFGRAVERPEEPS